MTSQSPAPPSDPRDQMLQRLDEFVRRAEPLLELAERHPVIRALLRRI